MKRYNCSEEKKHSLKENFAWNTCLLLRRLVLKKSKAELESGRERMPRNTEESQYMSWKESQQHVCTAQAGRLGSRLIDIMDLLWLVRAEEYKSDLFGSRSHEKTL